MKALVSKFALAAVVYPVTTLSASAQSFSFWSYWSDWGHSGGSTGGGSSSGGGSASSVPEIDASTGLLAIAAVAAALVLAWEIKRRRKA